MVGLNLLKIREKMCINSVKILSIDTIYNCLIRVNPLNQGIYINSNWFPNLGQSRIYDLAKIPKITESVDEAYNLGIRMKPAI